MKTTSDVRRQYEDRIRNADPKAAFVGDLFGIVLVQDDELSEMIGTEMVGRMMRYDRQVRIYSALENRDPFDVLVSHAFRTTPESDRAWIGKLLVSPMRERNGLERQGESRGRQQHRREVRDLGVRLSRVVREDADGESQEVTERMIPTVDELRRAWSLAPGLALFAEVLKAAKLTFGEIADIYTAMGVWDGAPARRIRLAQRLAEAGGKALSGEQGSKMRTISGYESHAVVEALLVSPCFHQLLRTYPAIAAGVVASMARDLRLMKVRTGVVDRDPSVLNSWLALDSAAWPVLVRSFFDDETIRTILEQYANRQASRFETEMRLSTEGLTRAHVLLKPFWRMFAASTVTRRANKPGGNRSEARAFNEQALQDIDADLARVPPTLAELAADLANVARAFIHSNLATLAIFDGVGGVDAAESHVARMETHSSLHPQLESNILIRRIGVQVRRAERDGVPVSEMTARIEPDARRLVVLSESVEAAVDHLQTHLAFAPSVARRIAQTLQRTAIDEEQEEVLRG